MAWTIERLGPLHDLAAFDCGEQSLNFFLKKHALNNDRAGIGRTFVSVETGQMRVVGYFTVSTGSITFDAVPKPLGSRLPRYPIPTIHLGRLAVDVNHQGKGMGEALLVESLLKAALASRSVGVYAVDVFALNDGAKRFYAKYGFVEMLDEPLHMMLPIATACALAGMANP